MGRIAPVLLALLFIAPAVGQDVDPGVDPTIVGDAVRPVANTIINQTLPPVEETTGDDLHSEEFHIGADISVTNIEYELVPILFGGGKVQADVRGLLTLDFHAVRADRLDDAIRAAAGNDNVSLYDTFGVPTDRVALTAEEIRAIGSGALLAAFQTQQEELATQYATDMLPGLRILKLDAVWKDTLPAKEVRDVPPDPPGYEPGIPSLRDPPLRLEVSLDLQYLDRLSLYQILEGVVTSESAADGNETEEKDTSVEDQVKANEDLPFLQRNAFTVLGINQFLNLELEPGWTLGVQVSVPRGFSIERATNELVVNDEKNTASYYVDGNEANDPITDGGLITVSNRFLVSSSLAMVVILLGVIIRSTTEIVTLAVARRRDQKRMKS